MLGMQADLLQNRVHTYQYRQTLAGFGPGVSRIRPHVAHFRPTLARIEKVWQSSANVRPTPARIGPSSATLSAFGRNSKKVLRVLLASRYCAADAMGPKIRLHHRSWCRCAEVSPNTAWAIGRFMVVLANAAFHSRVKLGPGSGPTNPQCRHYQELAHRTHPTVCLPTLAANSGGQLRWPHAVEPPKVWTKPNNKHSRPPRNRDRSNSSPMLAETARHVVDSSRKLAESPIWGRHQPILGQTCARHARIRQVIEAPPRPAPNWAKPAQKLCVRSRVGAAKYQLRCPLPQA